MKLKPSLAHIWADEKGCQAMGKMSMACKPAISTKKENDYALEGTIAGRLIEKYFKESLNIDTVIEIDNYLISDEMRKGARLFIDTFIKLQRQFINGYELELEEWLTLGETTRGRPDIRIYADGTLIILDYKFGRGIVEAFENKQLLTLMAAFIATRGIMPKKVILGIVQPRAQHEQGPVRLWEFDGNKAYEWYNYIVTKQQENLSGTKQAKAGLHCLRCPARFDCNTFLKFESTMFEYVSAAAPVISDSKTFASEYNALKLAQKILKSRLDTLEATVKSRIADGERISEFQLVRTETALKFKDDSTLEKVKPMAEMFGIKNISNPEKLRTPTQLIDDGFPKSLMKELATNEFTGHKLTHVPNSHFKRILQENE